MRKEKKWIINFRLGIEPGTQRLGVQYTKHQAITQDNVYLPILSYVRIWFKRAWKGSKVFPSELYYLNYVFPTVVELIRVLV